MSIFPQSAVAMRTLIAKEIWKYNECPWDFDNPPEGIAQLQKMIAEDQAARICAVVVESPLFRAYFAHKAAHA
jgi:hypothetical protein